MFVNERKLQDITINEIVPVTIIFEEIPIQASNTITICKRYDRSNTADTGTDISAKVSVTSNTNQAVLADIWLDAETETAGSYRVQVVMRDATGTEQKQEVNLLIKVKGNT